MAWLLSGCFRAAVPSHRLKVIKTLPILGLKPGLNPVLLPQAKAMGLPCGNPLVASGRPRLKLVRNKP